MEAILNFIEPYWNSFYPIIEPYVPVLIMLGKILLVVLPLLLGVAYLTYFERKVIAAMQLRKGPSVVGPFGLFQPLADGLKSFLKEMIIPAKSHKLMFLLAPALAFTLCLASWAVIPFNQGWYITNINVGVLYLLAISSLNVYSMILAGWSSNSRYAFLGALRATAQMVSYEVAIGLVVVSVVISAGSLNLSDIVLAQQSTWFMFLHFPMFIIFLASMLAETNRAPFDLPEAESELVAGYFVEYSGLAFAFFFLAEYANMILISSLGTILFLGGWLPIVNVSWLAWFPGIVWFGIKVTALLFFFVWARVTFPRFRYDQLMRLGWKFFLPISLIWVIISAGVVVYNMQAV